MNYRPRLLSGLLVLGLIIGSCQPSTNKKAQPFQADTLNVSVELQKLNADILSDSLNPGNYYLRSRYFLEQGDINRSLADISKALQLNNKESSYFVALSDIYLAMGRIPSCMEALKKAEELDPVNNEALLKIAEVYLILQDHRNTLEYTKKALDLDRINPVAHFLRGYSYMETGDTSLAIKNFQVAADQDPGYFDAFIELGVLYSALKDPLAVGYLQTATRIGPNRSEGYYLLGLAYQELENIPKAVETYEKLISISPDFKEAFYNLGYINLVYTNDFVAAVRYFDKAISLDPKYIDAYFNRGYSYELAGDFQNARMNYRKALEIEPNYERSVTGLNRLDSLESE